MILGSSIILKSATIYTRTFFMVQTADHRTGITGATPAVTISKAGAAFAAAAGAVSEIASGWYKIALTVVDTNTIGDLTYHITAASADPTDFADQVQATVTSDISINAFGQPSIASNIKTNQALPGFCFVMTSATTHGPVAGLTVTAQRSLGLGGFAPCANTVTGISNGVYGINLAASDLNAPCIMFRFTAGGADDLNILVITQP